MTSPLISFEHIDVRIDGHSILEDFSWTLGKGQSWAVIGGNGAGKTTLLRLIRGEVWPYPTSKGKRLYHFDGEASISPLAIRRQATLLTPEHQEMYTRKRWNISGRDTIRTGFFDTVWLYEHPTKEQDQQVDALMERLRLTHLADKPVWQMSTGEARRILGARAIVSRPRLLLLDEFCEGMDPQARQEALDFLAEIIQEGVSVIYTTHRWEEIIPEVSHVLVMDNGKATQQGESQDVLKQLRQEGREGRTFLDLKQTEQSLLQNSDEILLCLNECDVYLNRHKILKNIDFQVREGENWGIFGSNGSGKTTLLRLLAGDEYPALGGEIERFGKKKGVSVLELKSRLGIVSGALQDAYDHRVTGLEVVLSGFFSSIGLYEQPTDTQLETARHWMKQLNVSHLAHRPFQGMSFGERRRLLITRAMVNDPQLLLLDEPCSGLDPDSRQQVLELLESISHKKVQLVYITHQFDEILPCINRVAFLKNGELVQQGPRHEIFTENNISNAYQ